jgi:hypothetical protein
VEHDAGVFRIDGLTRCGHLVQDGSSLARFPDWRTGGYWNSFTNRIVLTSAVMLDGGSVRHEMLHSLWHTCAIVKRKGAGPPKQGMIAGTSTWICSRTVRRSPKKARRSCFKGVKLFAAGRAPRNGTPRTNKAMRRFSHVDLISRSVF